MGDDYDENVFEDILVCDLLDDFDADEQDLGSYANLIVAGKVQEAAQRYPKIHQHVSQCDWCTSIVFGAKDFFDEFGDE